MITLYSNTITKRLQYSLSESNKTRLVDDRNRFLSGAEFWCLINQTAQNLVQFGIRPTDRVIFLVKPSIEAIIYFFALLRVGAVPVLIDPGIGKANFNSRIQCAKANFIIIDHGYQLIKKYHWIKPFLRFFKIWFPDDIIMKTHRVLIAENLKRIRQYPIPGIIQEIELDNHKDMLIIFTSGTTSSPKGVVHSYNSLDKALTIISKEINIRETDRLYASQLYFLLIGLISSATIFIPTQSRFTAKQFIALAKQQAFTTVFLLPYEGEKIYTYLSKKKFILPNSLKRVYFGSAPVLKTFLQRFSDICHSALKVYSIYGATEILPIAIIDMVDKLLYDDQGDLLGKPVSGVSVFVTKENEIVIEGPQLFVRYEGDMQYSGRFFSGDIGGINSSGNLYLLGRKKDMIIRRGVNIYPLLFEPTISSISGIIECSLVGVYDRSIEDEKIVLFIVKEDNRNMSPDNIQSLLVTGPYSIDRDALPDKIIFINTLPRSGRSGKVDKEVLRRLAATQI